MKLFNEKQPEIIGAVLGLSILNLWYLSALAVDGGVLPVTYDYLIKGFTVAVGAFIGALSAFWLKKWEENKGNTKEQKSALNSALFVLVRQINAMSCIQKKLDMYKTPIERALSLPAFKSPDYSDVRQDISSLHFLIEINQPQMLMDLTIVQEKFEQAISSIYVRNEFYLREVQPALTFHALNGRPLPIAEFEEKLGERIFQGSLKGTENMYKLVEASRKSLDEKYELLRKLAKDIYPDEKFIMYEPWDNGEAS